MTLSIEWRGDPCSVCMKYRDDLEEAINELAKAIGGNQVIYEAVESVKNAAEFLAWHLDEYHYGDA